MLSLNILHEMCKMLEKLGHIVLTSLQPSTSEQQLSSCAAGPSKCRDKLLQARGWTVLSVPYFLWMQCQGELTLQQAFLHQLLLGYVDTGTCVGREKLKSSSTGRSTNNSNASTDDDEAYATPFGSS